MEKYQLYRTALDALQFLILSDLGFGDKTIEFLDGLFQFMSDSLRDEIHNVASHMTAKDVERD